MKKTLLITIAFTVCVLFLISCNDSKSKTESADNELSKDSLSNTSTTQAPDDTLVILPPAADEEVLTLVGKGHQVYMAIEKDGKLVWSSGRPIAKLYAPENQDYEIGNHGFDTTKKVPFWRLFKDKSMVRAILPPEKAVDAPEPKVNIKWLKLNVDSINETTGTLRRTRKIYRINTQGGQPTHAPTAADLNKPDSSYYTTDYLFYLKKN